MKFNKETYHKSQDSEIIYYQMFEKKRLKQDFLDTICFEAALRFQFYNYFMGLKTSNLSRFSEIFSKEKVEEIRNEVRSNCLDLGLLKKH